MPGKKKGKKKGKKSGKSRSSKSTSAHQMQPMILAENVPPPPKPMERLIKILKSHPVNEKELYGFKVSTRALEKLTPAEIRDLRLVFEAIDTHGRGYISSHEVKRAMRALGFKVTKEQARQMVVDASVAGKGVIDFNEFLDLVMEQQGDARDVYDEIIQGFTLLDMEGAGKISLEEVRQAGQDCGCKFTKQEVQDMVEEADLNGDGFVDKEEFVKVMLQTNLF